MSEGKVEVEEGAMGGLIDGKEEGAGNSVVVASEFFILSRSNRADLRNARWSFCD